MSSTVKKAKKKKNAFGATSPPFIDYLKDILRRYPDGGQILKELIQNADDAGASEVVFIHDERTYETGSLLSEDLGKYQGPALYAFNNAIFTEEDWHGIQATGRSVKRNDPNRVGRFGIGFNSVYHITDVPYIFSSKYLGLLDPQETIFGEGEGGFRWSLDDEEDRNVLSTLKDQFEPLRDIVKEVGDSTWEKTLTNKNFEGTLFRFPLRCESSEVSDNLYDASKVVQLFDSFITDADIGLLFLRHVSSVSLKHIDPSGSVTVKLTVSLSSVPPNLNSGDTDEATERSTIFKNISAYSPNAGERNTQWLVTSHCLDKGDEAKIDLLAERLCYRPQVDLAFPCDPENALSDGRLSCFLPLPNNESNKTGLPVHINACFGLTDNRRHIKWQDEDQKNDEAAQWNELLMTAVLPHTYLKMILDSIKFCRNSTLPAASVYRLWPNIIQMRHREKWHGIAKDVLERLLKDEAVFSLAKDEKIWVTLSDAVLPASDIEEPAIALAVDKVLKSGNENLIHIPEHVLNDLKYVCPEPNTLRWITPHFVRNVLQRSGLEDVSHNEKLNLLEYVLTDGLYQELEGLQLVPLDNGTFTKFTYRDGGTVLIDNQEFSRELLPFCKGVFISQELNANSLCHLKNLAAEETFNIINLDKQNVAELTKEHLPLDWKNGPNPVEWERGNPEHPPLGWLTEFWKYLLSHWVELGHFVNLPLLPVESPESGLEPVFLAKLQEKPTLVFQRNKHSSLSKHIQSVVQKVGGFVIKWDAYLKHHDIETFVLPPSPKSLLNIFLNLSRNEVLRGIHSASCTEKEELKNFLSSLDSLTNEELSVVSEIPLFQLMTGDYVCAKSKHAVSMNAAPTIPSYLPIPNSVVQCVTEADRRLLSMLKIELMDTAQLALYLVKCIEADSLNHENEKKIMTWVLQHGSTFFCQNKMLHNKCKDLTFIETLKQGQRKKASGLFDPNNNAFKKLFEPSVFPSADYMLNQQMLQSLHQLGLKSEEKDISPENVLEVVRWLEKAHTHSEQKSWERADVLIRVLNDNDIISKFSPDQLKQLQNMQWFPCESPYTNTKYFYQPCEIRHSKYHTVVGHVMPLIAELNEKLCKQLGLLNLPPVEKVIENLSVLNSMSQKTPDLDKDVQFKTKLHDTYKLMQDHTGLFKKVLKKDSVPWLWISHHFVSPCEVVLDYPHGLDLSSFIEKVPEEYLPFEVLLRESGVKLTLSEDEIKKILHDVKERIDRRNPPYGEPSELKVSINILNWMRKENKPAEDNTPVPVMAENKNFTLQHASNTLVCDISEEGLTDLKEDHEDFYVIHEEVSKATAEWLKIPLLSTRILNPEFIGIEQCGQTEPITQRIKNILREYDEDHDIFKELLQNAEDAGARTCQFMLDLRQHRVSPESLIDVGMTLCSGPCLWVFNDELFSDEDWDNITRVGSASKQGKVEKIGKFGIGFNAVYHVTDIPSILSGKKLLIFDPNVTHLKKYIQNKGNPGIRLDVFQERISRRFPGQFRSYEGIFDCDFSEKNTEKFYKGTLMKLPFRSPEESKISEINTKVYDIDRIMSFQQHLTHECQTHLLFLRNVEDLTLQILPENATSPPTKEQMKTLVQITRKVFDTIKIPERLGNSQQKSVISLRKHQSKWLDVIDSSVASISEMTQNNVEGQEIQYWLLYSCFGTHCSLKMVQDDKEMNMFSLPIGGIAVPLKKDPQTGKWTATKCSLSGQVFSFLPLSIQTGLPVNINGSFAVMTNRKSIWETGVKAEWNTALLKDAVTNAYITTLLILKQMSEKGRLSDYTYYAYWPDSEKVGKAFQPLVDAFYSAIVHGFCNEDLELFSDGKKWCSLSSVRFLDPAIVEHKEVGQIADKIFLNHQSQGSCAIPLPSWVRNSMIKCGFKDIVKDRTLTWTQFFRDVVFKHLDALDPQDRKAMILSAIDLNNDEVDELLKGHRCIPLQSGELQFIRTLVNQSGKVACLYDPKEGRFNDDKDFCSSKRIHRLIALGMLNDHLPLEDTAERASMISRVWETDKLKATQNLQCLFELMQELSVDQKSHHWSALKNTPFIPACSPLNTQVNNKAVPTLKKPCQVYSFSCHYLVNMTQFTVDHNHLKIHTDNTVLDKLGVCKSPPLHIVMRQLEEASKCDIQDKIVLHKIAYESYKYLNMLLSDQGSNQSNPDFIAEFAKSFPFLFVEDTFVHVNSVAKCQKFEAKPYLCVLPSVFSTFSTLWKCVGVQEQFSPQQFAAVLDEMRNKYGSSPLSDTDLTICLDILGKGLLKSKDAASQNYLVPDDKAVLRPSTDLYYNDSPWMPVSDVNLCHKLLSRKVACHFGVQTTRHCTLENYSVDGFPLYTQEFGQHEELTIRIKNIIDAYPAKKDIIKELIQNADDAEASEIHFILDERKHSTEKTFGKKWSSLQGPALCVYNNKMFTDADFQGIQRLGEGGKHGKCGKTGKYGLGFNSVYHLTDCPAIVTGDKLCIFDPHVKYVEMATKQKPGCMYSLQDQFKDSFMDVYQTFLPSDFRLETGTMFRLPLRTEQMAAKSEISKTVVRPQDIDEFMKVFAEDPDGLILFLKHIKKIECHRIGPDSDKLHTVYLIEKHLPEEDSIKKANFKDEVQRSLAPCQVIYNLQISSSNSAGKRKSQWAIAEHVGSPNPNTVQINEESDVSQIPQAAVAACVRVDPIKGDLKFNGRVFCSLPLPVVTGLPVHINANFEVDSSRRDLWKEDAMSLKIEWNESLKMDIISPLYADLLKHIQMTIKTGAHLSLYMLESELDSSFLSFFPFVSEHVNQEWHTMIKHVYRSIHEKNLSVIPVLDSSHRKLNVTSLTEYAVKWSNVHKQNPMDSPHFSGDFTASLFEILKNIGMRVVPPFQKTEKIYNSFQAAGVEVRMLCPNTVREYLKEKPLNDTSKTQATLPLPVNQTLIKNRRQCSSLLQFCIGGVDESNIDSIKGLPLLLTQDQMLRKFDNDSPRQYSTFWRLFKGQTAAFADIDNEVLEILQTGGYIQKLTIPVASEYLIPVLKKLQNEGKPPAWVKELWFFFAEQIMLESFKDRQANNIFSEIKKSFADSPIVPVISPSQNNKPFLKKMKDLSSVIRNPAENISRILIKLGFMTIDNSFFSLVKEVLRTHLQSELLKSDDSNAVLENLFQIPHSKFRMLSSDELDILQNYFQTGIKASQNSEEYQRMFKSLPLFQTVKGERQSIAEQSNIFILNAKCTETFPDLFNIHINGHVFLKYNLTNEQLSKNMNIDILTDLDFYVRFLLPSLHTFTETQVIESVQLLLNLKHHDKYKTCIDQIVAKLASVRFIRDIHGSLQLPSYFFDDDEPLYKIMLPQEKFVPSDFWKQFDSESDVRGLVRNLGMKHTVSDVEIIKFARTIESETHGKTSINELRKKSSALFKKAVKCHATNKKSNVLNNIATIKFIFPLQIQEELTNYHQPLAGKRDMVAIKGSLMEKHYDQQYLIWTSMPILPTSSFYKNSLESLVQVGAFDQPPCDLVAQNLKNICQSECQNDHLKMIRKKVFCQSYAYLQSEQAKTFSGSVLQDLPVVLVENDAVLVQASRAVLCLEDCNEFRPYLYQISPHYALYAEFFKMIGVEQRPTIRQYCTVLKDIYKDSKSKQTLNANQQLTLKRAMQHLFQLLKAQKNDPEQVNFEVSLYLPSTDGKLHKSDDLYFNDTVFQTKRLVDSLNGKVNLLMNLENCYLGEGIFEHQKLLLLLPKDSRPRMLSHVTCEKLVSCNMKLCEYRENCEFSGWFERHLNSSPFLHGLTSLIREQSKGTVSPDDAFKQCRNIFGKLQIICCETLETKVFLGQESLDKTISETQVHVKKESQGCSFYLKHSDNMDFKVIQEVVIRLTKEINSLLQNILCSDFLLALGQLLSCDSQDEVEKTLEKYAIHNTAGKQGAYHPPEPGSQIPEEWYDALDMRFMNNFEIGEYVGFKKTLESDHFYHAVVVERLDAASETSQYCCKYKIQIAKEEFTEVSSLDLYQFKREKMFAPEESFCGEIELANVPEPSAKEDFPSTFEEIKREIDKCLNEVWTMSKEEQHKAIKRLYLRWHPDKNPGQEQLANEAFKYLLNRLKGNDQSSTRNFRGENGTGPFRSWNFEDFYPQWNSEASYHRHGRKQFYRNTRRSHYNFWAFYQEMPRPNKEEAKRWYRQAQCDCDAAHYDSEAGRTEWCLFKIHQAVEKALIAAEYRRCGKHSPNCSISGLAQKVSCYSPELSTLPGIVSRLKGLGVDSKATQYPNYHPSPKIPNDAFQPENEKEALNMALELLQKVDSYLIK